jgi:hypothetical protein
MHKNHIIFIRRKPTQTAESAHYPLNGMRSQWHILTQLSATTV